MTLYSVSEAAAELGVSRQRVHQLLRALGRRPRQIGRTLVLTDKDLTALRTRQQAGRASHKETMT